MKKVIMLYLLFSLCGQVQAQTNNYDLSVGTTRYYDYCQAFYFMCVAVYTYLGVEEVVGDTLIGSQFYSIVNWKSELIYEDDITICEETSFYRFENGVLYKYTATGDSIVQNFSFSKGDTLSNYYSEEDLSSFVFPPPLVAIYDTVVNFIDNSQNRIIWGDDATQIPDIQTFIDSILIEGSGTWLLPFGDIQTYYPYKPFYFIDSIGVLFSEWNYRKMALVGVKKSNGVFYGQEVHFISGIENPGNDLKSFELYQNYPNPFNPSTNINFRLSASGNVEISIFNLLGQKVVTLFNGKKTVGNHSIKFNARELASGIYLYRITTNGYSKTKKMLYIR